MVRRVAVAVGGLLAAIEFTLSAVQPQAPREAAPLSHAGGALASPNIGEAGTLDILAGGGSEAVWSLDVYTSEWRLLFLPAAAGALAPAPAGVGAGAAIAAALPSAIAPTDFVFALRGGGTSDFWRYSISQNTWVQMPATPAPVGDGGALLEVAGFDSCGASSPFQLAALRGGGRRISGASISIATSGPPRLHPFRARASPPSARLSARTRRWRNCSVWGGFVRSKAADRSDSGCFRRAHGLVWLMRPAR